MAVQAEEGLSRGGKHMLSWELEDIERRFWFKGGKQTNVSPLLSAILGAIMAGAFFGTLRQFPQSYFAVIWMGLGPVPYAIAITFFWGLAVLIFKWRKLALQKRALNIRVVPLDYGFVLSPKSADQILENLYKNVQDPERFMLFNRILRAISNLKNMGRVSDVEVIIRAQSDMDHNVLESSYTILKGMIWAMPVLGFIGTVLGLSEAIGGFGAVLAAGGELSALRDSLRGVVTGLSVAFGTTFEGLITTLVLQLVLSFFRKSEEEFHEDCDDYCHRYLVSRLRLVKPEYETEAVEETADAH